MCVIYTNITLTVVELWLYCCDSRIRLFYRYIGVCEITTITCFLADAFGDNWQNEIPDSARIEPCSALVRGFPCQKAPHRGPRFDHGYQRQTSEMVGLSQRQAKNSIRNFLLMANVAFSAASFLPRISVADAKMPTRRIPSRRGRPDKSRILTHQSVD